MYSIPILNVLNDMKHEDGDTYLQKVMIHLLVNGERPIQEVAAFLGISESHIRRYLPDHIKDTVKKIKDSKMSERDDQIIVRYLAGEHPKSIAFEMKISMNIVYRVIRDYKKDNIKESS
jgi:DNA-directed RNA polymerase specialized sigma subunit